MLACIDVSCRTLEQEQPAAGSNSASDSDNDTAAVAGDSVAQQASAEEQLPAKAAGGDGLVAGVDSKVYFYTGKGDALERVRTRTTFVLTHLQCPVCTVALVARFPAVHEPMEEPQPGGCHGEANADCRIVLSSEARMDYRGAEPKRLHRARSPCRAFFVSNSQHEPVGTLTWPLPCRTLVDY